MIWIVWLLLCCGPAAIIYYLRRRPPLQFFLLAVGLSLAGFLLAWGFMSMTGAQRTTAILSGQVFGFVGLVIAYVLSIVATTSDSEDRPGLW